MDKDTKNKILVVSSVVVLSLFFAGYYFYRDLQRKNFEAEFSVAQALFESGDVEGAKHLFEEAKKRAVDRQSEIMSSFYLEVLNYQNDPMGALRFYKTKSLDESLEKQLRAVAVNGVLSFFIQNYGNVPAMLEMAKSEVFVGEKWKDFAKDGLQNRDQLKFAIRKAYEWSSELYSTPESEYSIASWYADKIKHREVEGDAVDYGDIIEKRIGRGDLAYMVLNYNEKVPSFFSGFNKILKGLALEGLFILKRVDQKQVEDNFNEAIAILEADPGNYLKIQTAGFARYHLARFFSSASPRGNAEKIESILAPLYTAEGVGVFEFLKFAKDAKAFQEDPHRNDIIKMAKIDSRFRERLVAIGWNKNEFK